MVGSEETAPESELDAPVKPPEPVERVILKTNLQKREVRHSGSYAVKSFKKRRKVKGRKNSRKEDTILTPEVQEEVVPEGSFEVERVVDKQLDEVSGIVLYLLKWKDYPSTSNTWEPRENLASDELLFQFETSWARSYVHAYEFSALALKVLAQLSEAKVNSLQTFIAVGLVPQDYMHHFDHILQPSMSKDEEKVVYDQLLAETYCAFIGSHSLSNTPKVAAWVAEHYPRWAAHAANIAQECLKLTSTPMTQTTRTSAFHLLCTAPITGARTWIVVDGTGQVVRNLTVYNDIDQSPPPTNFMYQCNNTVSARALDIVHSCNQEEFLRACICTDCNSPRACECVGVNRIFSFSPDGAMQVPGDQIISECSMNCRCPATCRNRTVQRGSTYRLQVYRTPNGRGWGLRTLEPIEANRFVIEYTGEILTHEEAEGRGPSDCTYLFDLDFYYPMDSNCAFTVDAGLKGNAARFINHSCDPNVFIMPVLINNVDVRLHRLAIIARKPIGGGQELTMDYEGIVRDSSHVSMVPMPATVRNEGDIHMKCLCGSPKCRKIVKM